MPISCASTTDSRVRLDRYRAFVRLLTALVVMLAASGAQAQTLDTCLQRQLQAAGPDSLAEAYRRNAFRLFWQRANGPTRQAVAMTAVLRAADAYGLEPQAYVLDAHSWTSACPQAAPIAVNDASLSAATLKLIRHLHSGRVTPASVGFDLPAKPGLDAFATLEELSRANDLKEVIARFEPQSPYYLELKRVLHEYRRLAADDALAQLPPLGVRSLRVDAAYAGATQLRMLLHALGDLPDSTAPIEASNRITLQLSDAVARFQARHGLQPDGVIGRRTFVALTTPISQRRRQIELTLERWRWLPPLQPPMVIINIPQYMLYALPRTQDKAELPLEIPVVVGRRATHTPVFADAIEAVTFRPYWNVPRSIVRNELLPQIQSDPAYLERHRLELLRGESDNAPVVEPSGPHLNELAQGTLRLRQRPGTDNALGLLKFELPNVYNIYLHDTPAAALFRQPARAFSHGCIRVGEPVRLARYVLEDTPGDWSEATIESAMNGPDNTRVRLASPIPVMVLYGTVLVTRYRGVMFFEDIYGHDQRLAQALR